jgi:hypothetical protein
MERIKTQIQPSIIASYYLNVVFESQHIEYYVQEGNEYSDC